MNHAELRALADALIECGEDAWPTPPEPIQRAADYLRAQADAQPVAWMYEHDGCVDTPLFTVNRWTKCEEPWNESPLFLHPAPAKRRDESFQRRSYQAPAMVDSTRPPVPVRTEHSVL